jgi:hypothetical protein
MRCKDKDYLRFGKANLKVTKYDLRFYWAKRLKEEKAKSQLALSLLAFKPVSPKQP